MGFEPRKIRLLGRPTFRLSYWTLLRVKWKRFLHSYMLRLLAPSEGWRRVRGCLLSAPLGTLRGSEGRRTDPPRAAGGGPLGSEGTL